MTRVNQSRIVPYTCAQMYDLVDEVERYAEFLPYFVGSEIHHRYPDEVQATVSISAAGVHKSFTTRNLLQKNKMIEMRLVEGPFNHLEGFWRFDETPNGCSIALDLEFELAGRMFSMLLGPVFEQVTHAMVDAFCARADALYAAIHHD